MKTVCSRILHIDGVLAIDASTSDHILDIVVKSAATPDASDYAATKSALADRSAEFGKGLAGAIDAHEVARVTGLPASEHAIVLAALLEKFDELANAADSVLRVYLKTKRYRVAKDGLSLASVKRLREPAQRVGHGTDGASDAQARPSKVAKTSSTATAATAAVATKKVPLADACQTVERVVDRFELVIAGLCDEIRRLRGIVRAQQRGVGFVGDEEDDEIEREDVDGACSSGGAVAGGDTAEWLAGGDGGDGGNGETRDVGDDVAGDVGGDVKGREGGDNGEELTSGV